MACDPQDLINNYGGSQFASKSENEKEALKLSLLCKIWENGGGGGGGPHWGNDGDNVVRPLENVYVLDSFTGLYHAIEATSEFSPGIVQMGLVQTGYAFDDIPD